MGTRLIRTRPRRWRPWPVPSKRGLGTSRSAMEVTMATMMLTVNGSAHTVDVDPATPLLYVLSDDLNLRGPKFGCGLGQCGACTVLAQGRAIRSCVTPAGTITGVEITTLEGLGTLEQPHPLLVNALNREQLLPSNMSTCPQS